jgi:hypothetical protein
MKKIRIRMIKTQAPDEIPNGTLGWLFDEGLTGLMRADFDTGWCAFVYRSEVEVTPDSTGAGENQEGTEGKLSSDKPDGVD